MDLADKSSGRSQQSPPNLIENFADKLSTIGQTVFGLGQSEARFREVIEALPAAIYTTDGTARIT